ncbi:peptide-methionine (S)-S-oxide reductase MsrA [Bartonella tamiae]|uniref:Peptide methionine sulfoxide reductase MsrA n=1 Tax=Bartonella tamiae Th239 TaxID=1094558 RepID=J1JZU3_9HYPH|nr:peptide-methionine (S)-S-oxide reductase MsrA [Bartonella tamiae]EJF90275.1 peptide-methionine (S)-S-oxide reductase [Bartonella tamiae Th239]EJF93784.1 peptide-methionine (S)-S-oxide reductase [Bartonella tamiae Th307]
MYTLSSLFEKTMMPSQDTALPGRSTPIQTAQTHFVNGRKLKGPYPEGLRHIVVAMGCFWGVERLFWNLDGVYVTAVGYIGGFTPNPTYEEVCTGKTGHTEGALIVYDPKKINLQDLLAIFWEEHNPTQGMRQGNDVGNNYRSALYLSREEDFKQAVESKELFQKALDARGLGKITTEIEMETPFYFAEDYHQQYLAKNPNGYCGLKGTGVSCPIPLREVVK